MAVVRVTAARTNARRGSGCGLSRSFGSNALSEKWKIRKTTGNPAHIGPGPCCLPPIPFWRISRLSAVRLHVALAELSGDDVGHQETINATHVNNMPSTERFGSNSGRRTITGSSKSRTTKANPTEKSQIYPICGWPCEISNSPGAKAIRPIRSTFRMLQKRRNLKISQSSSTTRDRPRWLDRYSIQKEFLALSCKKVYQRMREIANLLRIHANCGLQAPMGREGTESALSDRKNGIIIRLCQNSSRLDNYVLAAQHLRRQQPAKFTPRRDAARRRTARRPRHPWRSGSSHPRRRSARPQAGRRPVRVRPRRFPGNAGSARRSRP